MQLFFAVVGKQWGYVQAASSSDDRLAVFSTMEEAETDLVQHVADLNNAGMDTYLDWEVVRVRDINQARSICSRAGVGMPAL